MAKVISPRYLQDSRLRPTLDLKKSSPQNGDPYRICRVLSQRRSPPGQRAPRQSGREAFDQGRVGPEFGLAATIDGRERNPGGVEREPEARQEVMASGGGRVSGGAKMAR